MYPLLAVDQASCCIIPVQTPISKITPSISNKRLTWGFVAFPQVNGLTQNSRSRCTINGHCTDNGTFKAIPHLTWAFCRSPPFFYRSPHNFSILIFCRLTRPFTTFSQISQIHCLTWGFVTFPLVKPHKLHSQPFQLRRIVSTIGTARRGGRLEDWRYLSTRL